MKSKSFICAIVLWCTFLAADNSIAQNPFSSFIEGQRQAEIDNWNDAMRAQQLRQMQIQTQEKQRQEIITKNIIAFNNTSDFRYLYVASQYGSLEAKNYLIQNRVRCMVNSKRKLICKK